MINCPHHNPAEHTCGLNNYGGHPTEGQCAQCKLRAAKLAAYKPQPITCENCGGGVGPQTPPAQIEQDMAESIR